MDVLGHGWHCAEMHSSEIQPFHLHQVHDLLTRIFWANVDGLSLRPSSFLRFLALGIVSDSLQHSPQQCTVVATYKSVVVGVAILTSPEQTYLTYLAVRAGWENCQIATYVRAGSNTNTCPDMAGIERCFII